MENLKIFTRADTNARGKAKVWFSAHPEDHEKYFEAVARELLEQQNCAVLGEADSKAPFSREELIEIFNEINMLVIPVTARLLRTQNSTVDVVLPLAQELCIPVLPLMQETGLEKAFNDRCGTIQFLDKANTDATAIPYVEKLRSFLAAVLVGDEMAKRIRAAFDAHVFLSYRKKDRKYAQELMRLIHANELCRDIAIWYDEFLVPGERFDDAIRKTIEKSDLFAVVVTPHLTEQGNYVIKEEYPTAHGMGKDIFAAELQPTDWDELSRCCEGIPKPIDPRDSVLLSEALLKAFHLVALRKNDHDPQHNFFIGLAYLEGIDVEIDHRRALSLIEKAASQGLREAMKKLVSMYSYGVGVARDFEKTILWQKEYVSSLATVGDDEESLFLAWVALGDLYKNLLGDGAALKAARDSYMKAVAIGKEKGKSRNEWRWLKLLSDVYIKLGDLCSLKEDCYRRSYCLRKQLLEITSSENAKRDFALINIRVGDALAPEEAMTYYQSALALLSELLQEDTIRSEEEAISLKRVNALVHYKLGKNCLARKDADTKQAENYYLAYRRLQEEIARITDSLNDKKFLAVALQTLGRFWIQCKVDPSQIEEVFRECKEIRAVLVEKVGTPEAIEDCMRAEENYGLLYRLSAPMEALSFFKRALAIVEPLAEKTQSDSACFAVARLCYEIWSLGKDRTCLMRARKVSEMLWRKKPCDPKVGALYDEILRATP